MRALKPILLSALLTAGCTGQVADLPGNAGVNQGNGGLLDGGGLPPLPDGGASTPYMGEPVVYAHSSGELYRIDPAGLTVTLVGAFKWPGNKDDMTDIALDRNGKMTGISFTKVYAVDPKTAVCTYLAPLQTPGGVGSFCGLSYIARQTADAQEVLVAAATDGSLYQVDPQTGQSTPLGNFGGGLGASGDLVSVKGLTLATVKHGNNATDWLARVDPLTGQATLIGDTGFTDVFGLGYWKDRVYGFTDGNRFILIDPSTGKGTLAATSSSPWWGAGVTTAAPVIE